MKLFCIAFLAVVKVCQLNCFQRSLLKYVAHSSIVRVYIYVILSMMSRQRSRLGFHLSDNVDIWWTDLNFMDTKNSFMALSGPCAGSWRVVNVLITLSDPLYRLAEGYLPIFD